MMVADAHPTLRLVTRADFGPFPSISPLLEAISVGLACAAGPGMISRAALWTLSLGVNLPGRFSLLPEGKTSAVGLDFLPEQVYSSPRAVACCHVGV